MTGMDIAELLGNLGDFFGAIAVFGTIIYLAVQVRYSKHAVEANTRALENQHKLALAQAYQVRATALDEAHRERGESTFMPPIAAKLRSGTFADLDPEEQSRCRDMALATFWRLDNSHFQREQGFITDSHWEHMTLPQIRKMVPIWQDWGVLENVDMRPAFGMLIDELGAEIERSSEAKTTA